MLGFARLQEAFVEGWACTSAPITAKPVSRASRVSQTAQHRAAQIGTLPRQVHPPCNSRLWNDAAATHIARSSWISIVRPLPAPSPKCPQSQGSRSGPFRAGYKDWDRSDLTPVELSEGTRVAGSVYQERMCRLRGRTWPGAGETGQCPRAGGEDAGNANAFTGYRGREAVEAIMFTVAERLDCEAREVFVSLDRSGVACPCRRRRSRGACPGVRRACLRLAQRNGNRNRHHRYLWQRRDSPRP